MEFTTSAITAAFVGMIWALIKVVEYFISRNKKNVNGLTSDQNDKLNVVYDYVKEVEKHGTLNKSQDDTLLDIQDIIEDLQDLHMVFDDNRIPKWYVPSELLPIVRKTYGEIQSQNKEINSFLRGIENGQNIMVDKLIELMSSQKIMIERLGDLIGRININSK